MSCSVHNVLIGNNLLQYKSNITSVHWTHIGGIRDPEKECQLQPIYCSMAVYITE